MTNLAYERMRTRLVDRGVVGENAMIGVLGAQHTRAISADAKMLRVVAMTDRVALDRLVVVPGGCDDSYIKANKRVFLDHNTDWYSCVGTIRDYKINATDIRADVALATAHEDYPQLVALASEVGIATSIGFEITELTPPMKGDPPHYFDSEGVARRWRWLELSLTMMPSDVYAQASSERSWSDTLTRSVSALVESGKVAQRLMRMLGYSQPQPVAKRKVVFTPRKA